MTATEKLKDIMEKQGYNINSFATKFDIPYMTVKNVLDRGVEKSSVTVIIKICNALGITIDDLLVMTAHQNADDKTILWQYNRLNDEGKQKFKEYLADILSLEKYKKER